MVLEELGLLEAMNRKVVERGYVQLTSDTGALVANKRCFFRIQFPTLIDVDSKGILMVKL